MSLDVDAVIMKIQREGVMRVKGRFNALGNQSCLINALPRDHAWAAICLGVSRDKLNTFVW